MIVCAAAAAGVLAGCGSRQRAGEVAAERAVAAGTPCLVLRGADRAGTGSVSGELGDATASVTDPHGCYRKYELATTQPLRGELRDDAVVGDLLDDEGVLRPERGARIGAIAGGGGAPGPRRRTRRVAERPGAPTLRTGSDLVDALYAMTLDEVRQASVDSIHDRAFRDGAAVSCGDGGCYETGAEWNYVWTRDIAYAVHLGLANLDPERARNSLEVKLSERRGGGDLQIVQDTGTGGSYPISTDRVAWALGAHALYLHLEGRERASFRRRALDAIANTLEHDREVVYDPRDGLYRGETSFLDWREQSYPAWTADDTVHIGMSKALSTNLVHLRAMEVAAAMAGDAGEEALRSRYSEWAGALRESIRATFWLDEPGLYSSFTTTGLDPAPARRYDLLGSAFAVIFGVATADQARSILARYPHYGRGAPVIWPQQPSAPIYHNRGEWPFVSAYWLRAAAAADNAAVADRMVRALVRGAALNLSNMENFEAGSGAPWKEEGALSGPVVNSERQLWSVAGFLSMVHRTWFGLEARPRGLAVSPYITRGLRSGMFSGTDALILNDYPFRGRRISVVVHLPPEDGGEGSYAIERVEVGGEVADAEVIEASALADGTRIDVHLRGAGDPLRAPIEIRSAGEHAQIFGPEAPRIASVRAVEGGVRVAFERRKDADEGGVELAIVRGGETVASGLPGGEASWVDTGVDPGAGASPCYAVRSCFESSGNCSQRSPPVCLFGPENERVHTFGADEIDVRGGERATRRGRAFVAGFGAPGDALKVGPFRATRSAPHAVRVVYANAAGPINTGITAAVARIVVTEVESGAIAGEGYTVMPHLGDPSRWGESSLVFADLEAGERYEIAVSLGERAINMSAFAHFEAYTAGAGGADGPHNRADIAALQVLPR